MTSQSILDQCPAVVAPNAERIEIVEGGRSSGWVAATRGRPAERFSIRRKRLLFRSWSRGTQESDLILGSFADSTLESLDEKQLDHFEALLDCSDPDLFDWILGRGEPRMEYDHDVLHMLCAFWTRRAHGACCGDESLTKTA